MLRKIERLEKDLENRPAHAERRGDVLAAAGGRGGGDYAAVAGADEELRWWASAFERSCTDHRDDLLHIAAWTDACLRRPDGSSQRLGRIPAAACWRRLEAVPSLREVAALAAIDAAVDRCDSDRPRQPRSTPQRTDAPARRSLARRNCVKRSSIPRSVPPTGSRHWSKLASQCQEFADMDFSFLFDKSRDLFAIGYNVGDQRLDNSFYDLLASEARLASLCADRPGPGRARSIGSRWAECSRRRAARPTLLSWSGSMFEYLMPLLVMPTYENTLLDQTYRAAVRRQIAYGKQRGVPWGISESGYNTIDAHMNYQYRAFGVPGLGLKRGLAEDLVIAPYASALALMVAPEAACANLERLAAEGHARRLRLVRGRRLHAVAVAAAEQRRASTSASSWPITRG